MGAVAQSGANVLSVDWRTDLAELRSQLGPKIALQGNLDPAILFAPEETVIATTKNILKQLGGHGHILNLGHGILPNTSVEAAQRFIRTSQQYVFSHANATNR